MTYDTSAAKVITPCKKTPEADVAELQRRKPRLLIEKCSPDRTVAALRDILKGSPDLYDRGLKACISALFLCLIPHRANGCEQPYPG